MRSHRRTLAPILLSILLASAAQAQTDGTPLPNGEIGVQFEFVPFSAAPRAPVPRALWIVPADPALNCPMPVLHGNTSADTAMVVPPIATVPSRPMPGAGTHAAPGCDNPLGRPRPARVLLW